MLAMLLIEDVMTLLMMLKDCCQQSRVHVPLLCCLHFVIGIAIPIIGLPSGCSCSCCCGVPVALGGKDVMVTNMVMLLLMIKYCWGKQTKTTSKTVVPTIEANAR